jgi:hypothetical protein
VRIEERHGCGNVVDKDMYTRKRMSAKRRGHQRGSEEGEEKLGKGK